MSQGYEHQRDRGFVLVGCFLEVRFQGRPPLFLAGEWTREARRPTMIIEHTAYFRAHGALKREKMKATESGDMESAVHSTKTVAIECVYTIWEMMCCRKKKRKEKDDPGDVKNDKANHIIKQHEKEEAETKEERNPR